VGVGGLSIPELGSALFLRGPGMNPCGDQSVGAGSVTAAAGQQEAGCTCGPSCFRI
jgi:hypothetical protein